MCDLDNNNWKSHFENCLSIKFICNLNLSHIGIGDKGAIAIAKALKTNSTLQKIDLGINQIGAKGASAIANALKINFTLQKINLRSQ